MKVAQIGLGGWGRNHSRILSHLGALCAVCDTDPARSKEYGERYSVNHYQTVEELLAAEEFDGAFVVTPTKTHAGVAQVLLEAKKHVFVEKPLTHTAADGERLARLAERNKVILTCGYIERFNPAVRRVKEIVTDGTYGELIMLEFHRENRIPLHIKDVGIIHDTSTHDIDTANWLFGMMPHVVFARAGSIRHEHEDFASIMLGYENQRVAMISSNWITPKKLRRFDAVCTNGVISSDFITQKITVEEQDSTTTIDSVKQEPLLLEIQSFLAAMDGAAEHPVKAGEAVNVTRIAEAALLSSQKGIPIYLDLK